MAGTNQFVDLPACFSKLLLILRQRRLVLLQLFRGGFFLTDQLHELFNGYRFTIHKR